MPVEVVPPYRPEVKSAAVLKLNPFADTAWLAQASNRNSIELTRLIDTECMIIYALILN